MDAACVPKSLQMRDLRLTAGVERVEGGVIAAELGLEPDTRSRKAADPGHLRSGLVYDA